MTQPKTHSARTRLLAALAGTTMLSSPLGATPATTGAVAATALVTGNVLATGTATAAPNSPQAPLQAHPSVKVIKTFTSVLDPRKVQTKAKVSIGGFPANTPLTVNVDGKPASWENPATRKPAPTLRTDAQGNLNAGVITSSPATHGRPHTITISTVDKHTSHTIKGITFDVGTTFSNTTINGYESGVGATGNLIVGNVPAGTQIVFFGVPGGHNWLKPHQRLLVPSTRHILPIFGVHIPAHANLVGRPAVVGFRMPGKPTQYTTVIKSLASSSPVRGNPHFSVTYREMPGGLYQSAYSKRTNSLYVSRTRHGHSTTLYRIDPRTLKILAQKQLPKESGIFGLTVDDMAGTVWASNATSDSLTVFKQDDLSVVRTYPKGEIKHARDMRVDPRTGKVYVSGYGMNSLKVVSTKHNRVEGTITAPNMHDTMHLALDPASNQLFTVNYTSPHLLRYDLASGKSTVYKLPDTVEQPSGVAWDPVHRNVYIASQMSGDVTVFNLDSQRTIARIPTGSGALSAVYEPVHKHVYVANRAAGTVSVIDTNTMKLIDNIKVGEKPNNVSTDGKGNVFVVNKQSHYLRGEPRDHLVRISYDPNRTFTRPHIKGYTPKFIPPTVAGLTRGVLDMMERRGKSLPAPIRGSLTL